MVEHRLDAAGVTGFQVEKTATGFRFTCQLPSGAVAGRGATRGEAVRNALAQLADRKRSIRRTRRPHAGGFAF